MIPPTAFSFKQQKATPTKTIKELQNEEKTVFLCAIEEPVLDKLFEENKISLYNKKTSSKFLPGNKFGGAKGSGQPSKPLKIGEFAFESISCAANALGKDRKLIRIAIKKTMAVELTVESWTQWDPSKKVTSENAEEFRMKRPNFYEEAKKTG
jgi:hypothetical protein